MWALRVRKTRREFDKWEVNEHRDEVRYRSSVFSTAGFLTVDHVLDLRYLEYPAI